MLRKRARSYQKEQRMNSLMAFAITDSYFRSEFRPQKHRNTAFLNVPSLFVGYSPECDSSGSPTSPLDFRIFSGLGNPFRRPRVPPNEGFQKSWDCQKVGLSIVHSLDDQCRQSGKVVGHSENKMILLGRRMSVKSLNLCSRVASVACPTNVPVFLCDRAESDDARKGSSDVVFEIGRVECEPELVVKNPNFACCASEIELSEDYTCVRRHGSNPRIIHIFGDCILECRNDQVTDFPTLELERGDDFLKFCYSCRQKLDGLDIYMYRGEKAFCSSGCRAQEIENDDDTDVKVGDDPFKALDGPRAWNGSLSIAS